MQYFFVGNMNKTTNFSISFQNSCFSNKILLVLLIRKLKAILEPGLPKITKKLGKTWNFKQFQNVKY